MDILATIDAALGCQRCGGPLGSSPSPDFCSDGCQEGWHAAGADELREPFALPRSTPDLPADRAAARRAQAAATTEQQRAAVRMRLRSLQERHRAAALAEMAAMWPAMRAGAQRRRDLGGRVAAALRGPAGRPGYR